MAGQRSVLEHACGQGPVGHCLNVAVHCSRDGCSQGARAHRLNVAGYRSALAHVCGQGPVVPHANVARHQSRHSHGQAARGRPVVLGRVRGRRGAARYREARIRGHPARRPDLHVADDPLIQEDGGVHVLLSAHRLHRPIHDHAVNHAIRDLRPGGAPHVDADDDGMQGVVGAIVVRVNRPPTVDPGCLDVKVSEPEPRPVCRVRPLVDLRADGRALAHPDHPGGVRAARVNVDGGPPPGEDLAGRHVDEVALYLLRIQVVSLRAGQTPVRGVDGVGVQGFDGAGRRDAGDAHPVIQGTDAHALSSMKPPVPYGGPDRSGRVDEEVSGLVSGVVVGGVDEAYDGGGAPPLGDVDH